MNTEGQGISKKQRTSTDGAERPVSGHQQAGSVAVTATGFRRLDDRKHFAKSHQELLV